MDHLFQVLSVGYERSLMSTRSMLLRSAGYAVEEARSRQEALSLARSDLIDIILICHTVPERERKVVVDAVRKQRSLIPILYVSDRDYDGSSGDGCTLVSNTPVELLAAIDSAVRQARP